MWQIGLSCAIHVRIVHIDVPQLAIGMEMISVPNQVLNKVIYVS